MILQQQKNIFIDKLSYYRKGNYLFCNTFLLSESLFYFSQQFRMNFIYSFDSYPSAIDTTMGLNRILLQLSIWLLIIKSCVNSRSIEFYVLELYIFVRFLIILKFSLFIRRSALRTPKLRLNFHFIAYF